MIRPKAFSYVRFSTPEQATGASVRRQLDAARAFAKAHDLDLDESLRDEGVSAFRGRNRNSEMALGRFLTRVESGVVPAGSFLLVESFDRLSREQVSEALELFLTLTRHGITVATLSDNRTYSRASIQANYIELIISIIIMSRAYEESEMKSQRVGDAWRRKRVAASQSGQAMTARCPAWIKLVGGPRTGHYELIGERAKIVSSIFEWTIAGDGRRTISKRLNGGKVETWGPGRSKATQWHDSYIQKILRSPAVMGRYEMDGVAVEGYFPRVVEDDTFYRANAAASARSSGTGKTSASFNNLLKGLCSCHNCGNTMIYNDKGARSRPALICSNAHAGAGCTNRARYDYANIQLVVLHAYTHFADAAIFATNEESRRLEDLIQAEEYKKAAAEKRRERLLDIVDADEAMPHDIRNRLDVTMTQITESNREIVRLKASDNAKHMASSNLDARSNIIYDLISTSDSDKRYQNRSALNARLSVFIKTIVILENSEINIRFNPGYENIDEQMLDRKDPWH